MLSKTRWFAALAWVAAVPFLAYCGDDDGGDDDDDDDMMMEDGGMTDPDGGSEDPVLVSIAVTPEAPSIEVGETQALTVTGTFDDDSTEEITSGITFASSDDAVATVDGSGVVTGVAEGSATITATVMDVSDTAQVTVTVPPPDPVVFDDDFGDGVEVADFGGATNALVVDTSDFEVGSASLRAPVPAGGYTGGALVVEGGRDLSTFNALQFWAKASTPRTLDAVGFGSDAAGSPFETGQNVLVGLTTEWQQFTIPVPNPAKATSLDGLFYFAENDGEGAGDLWFDDIRFVSLDAGTITNPRPSFATEAIERSAGSTFTPNGATLIYDVDGTEVLLNRVGLPFFDFISSDEDVVTFDELGVGTAVAEGTATVTAEVDGVAAAGTLTVTVVPFLGPTVAPPTPPTRDDADVVSLFSDAYDDVTVDTFRTPWSWGTTMLTDETVEGDAVKKYASTVFFGIETVTEPVDASDMTHLHLDLWVEGDIAEGQVFTIKLVDLPGGPGNEAELLYNVGTTPALVGGEWISFDIPLSEFEEGGSAIGDLRLDSFADLDQYVIKSEIPAAIATTIWIDNLYFYAAE